MGWTKADTILVVLNALISTLLTVWVTNSFFWFTIPIALTWAFVWQLLIFKTLSD